MSTGNDSNNSHSSIRLHGEQMVVAPREVRRAHDHQAANVAVSGDITHFCKTAWAEEAFAFHLRVADAQRGWRCVRKAHRKAHDHEVRRGIRAWATGASDCTLSGRWDEFKEKILEMALVHRDTALPWVWQLGDAVRRMSTSPDHVPPVFSQRSRHIFISAASATIEMRMRSFRHPSSVSCMLPGSQVVNDPKMMVISLEECVGRWLMLLRAISMAFCRLGSPLGSSLCRSEMAFRTSCGLPGRSWYTEHVHEHTGV